MSPPDSIARQQNWAGFEVVKVLKFLYFTRSYALTVPSKLALTTALPFFEINCNAVTFAVWSLMVKNRDSF